MKRNGNSVTLELIKKIKDKNRKKQIERKRTELTSAEFTKEAKDNLLRSFWTKEVSCGVA